MRDDASSAQSEIDRRQLVDDSEESSSSVTRVARDRERLEYLANMIAELRDMAQDLTQSPLPAILDAALIEARLCKVRRGT